MAVSIPGDSFLHEIEPFGARRRRKIWRDGTGSHLRYYTWDALHGEVEVFNARGRHLGAVDPVTKAFMKNAEEGRILDL